jgi:GMP synthase (glutamine-hydrolysing)
MAKRVVLIKHEESPGDDRAATWLAEQGFELDWRAPFNGDSLEEPGGDLAGTVIYGGGQSLTETAKHPFLKHEARWAERCMARSIPTLGLCLGGQIIAHSLGAAVGPGPDGTHEFGYYPLFPTEAGRCFLPDGLHVAQAHSHEFALPAGAVLLARSELYHHQAFRYGETTYGFQFHPECTRRGFRRWQDADWAPWDQPGVQSRERQDALAAEHDDVQDAWFRDFLGKLFGRPNGET